MSSLAEMATIFLAPKDRDAVLGDLAETGASGWSALGSVLGLVVRQQMELWRAWQTWVASSLAFAGSLLLLGVSFGLSADSRHLLRGDGKPFHVYELASLLQQTSDSDAFWTTWQEWHHPSLRRLEAICFSLAHRWFDCRLSPAASEEIAALPPEVNQIGRAHV